MNPFYIIGQKEWTQLIREAKIIWMPLAFMFLGAAQPVLIYFLPSILEAAGGGQGITIDSSVADQTGGQVLAAALASQFDQLGVIIIVVSAMGIIQADKVSGMLAFILTKPVSIGAYIGGKMIAGYLAAALSVSCGFVVAFLYTNYLFMPVPFGNTLTALLLYLVWVLFIVSFTAMVSALFNGQGIIALISIAFLLACRITAGMHPILDWFNPASLSFQAAEILASGSAGGNLLVSMATVMVWIFFTVTVSYKRISQKKF